MGFEETIRKFFFRKPKLELEGEEGKPKEQIKCEKCKSPISAEAFKDNLNVCPKCGYHAKIGARSRLSAMGEFTEAFTELESTNILGFPSYDEKLEKARKESGESDGVIAGKLKFLGKEVWVFAFDYRFMMGSMGTVAGEKITRTFECAEKEKLPVLGFILSGGARMQEGILSLMQMAKTSAAAKKHSDAGLLYLAVLTDPTTGGVSASFAYLADIIIAEPNALIGFAGPRVIEQTTRQKLPNGFQTAEFVQKKGFVDMIVKRTELCEKISALLDLHRA